MESVSSIKIDQLNDTNYHAWKILIQHVLVLKGPKKFIDDDPPQDPVSQQDWIDEDEKARAVIGLTLTDTLLENVREANSAKEMWIAIKNVFERHTLLNKLSARRRFYTATLAETETVLPFSNRIQQLAAILKAMNVEISESEKAMVLLNGLPDKYNALISALDAIDDQETDLKWEFIKSRILQEEQHIGMRARTALEKTESAALLSKIPSSSNGCRTCGARATRPTCNYCKKIGHVEAKCWKKNPHLNPHKRNTPTPALIAQKNEDDPVICLMAKYESSDELPKSGNWFIDSGCSNHMTYDKSMFSSYSPGHHSPVNLGNSKTVTVAEQSTLTSSLTENL